MNCRRVEQLIPLYVEGDLAATKAIDLASHLEWCGRCNWLADEYRESQTWLRTSEPPKFDGVFLESFKTGVLTRIEQDVTKPSRLAVLMQQWTRRQIFALAAAASIILGVVVFYIYQASISTRPQAVEARRKTDEPESEPNAVLPQPNDTGVAPRAGSNGPHHASNRRQRKMYSAPQVAADQTAEPLLQVQQTQVLDNSTISSAQPTDVVPTRGSELPEMLRIEIQTSDPTIRIIWFAPKETEIPKTTN